MNRIITAILIALTVGQLHACEEQETGDALKFKEILKSVQLIEPATKAGTTLAFAKEMLGTAYVAGTLEREPEQLIVNLDSTDCILFVESAVAFTLTWNSGKVDFEHYCDFIRQLRYRDGIVSDYTSRIHYTSEWLLQAQERGYITEITGDLCREAGIGEYAEHLGFMSAHPGSYPALTRHPEMIQKIRQMEERLNRETYYVIPKDRIGEIEDRIQDGDIIAFNTSIDGLDISHVGIACRENGRLTFIHASSAKKEVIVNESSLADYCRNSRRCDGIRVARIR